ADGVGNEVQSLAFSSEVQKLTLGANGSTTLSFDGASATSPLAVTLGAGGTTAAAVLANLNTIAALKGNVSVTGNNGGPFTVTFTGALGGHDISQIVSSATGVANFATTTSGAAAG